MTDARRQTEPDDRGRQEQPGGYSRERHDTAQAQPSDGAPREVQRSERLSGYDRGRDPRGDGESGHGRGGRRTQSPPPLRRGSPGRQPGGSHERDRPHDSGREREAGHAPDAAMSWTASDAAAVWAPRPVDELLPMRDRHDHGDVGGGGDDAGRSGGQDAAWQGWAPDGEPAPQREGRGPEGNTPALGHEGNAYRDYRHRTQQPGNRTVAAYEEHDGHEAPRAYAEGADIRRQWLTGPDGSGEVWPAGAQRPQGAGEAQVAARAGSGRHQQDWQRLHQQALLGSGDHGSAATQRQAPAIPPSGPSEPRRQHSNGMPPLPPPALEQLPGDHQQRGSRAPYMTHGAWTSSLTPLGSASAALSGRLANSGDSGSRQASMQAHVLPQLQDRSVARLPPLQPRAPSTASAAAAAADGNAANVVPTGPSQAAGRTSDALPRASAAGQPFAVELAAAAAGASPPQQEPSTAATVAPGAAESKSPAAPGSPVSPNKNWMAKVLQGKQAVATQASSPTAASAFSLAVPPSRINPLAAAPPPQQQPQQTEASTAATSRSPIHDRPFLAAAGGAGGPAAVPLSPQPGAGAATAPVAGRGGTAAAVRPSAGAAGDTDDDFEVEVVRECAAPPSAAGAFAAVGGTAAVATAMHMSLLRDDSACAEMSAALAGPGARAAAGPSRQTGVPPGSPLKEQPQLPTHLQARPTKQSLPQPAASQQSMPLLGAALQAPTALTGELPQQQLAAAVPLAAESRAAGAAAQAGPGAKVESSGCAASDSSAGGPLSLRQQAAEDRVHVAAVGGSKAAEVDLACREDTGAAAAGGTAGAGVAVDTSPAPAVAPPAMRASADVRAAAVAPAVSKQPTGTAAGDTADAVHAVVDSDGHQEQEMAARTLATGDPGVAPAGVPPGVAAAAGSPTARAPQGIPAVALQPEPQPAAGAADPGAGPNTSAGKRSRESGGCSGTGGPVGSVSAAATKAATKAANKRHSRCSSRPGGGNRWHCKPASATSGQAARDGDAHGNRVGGGSVRLHGAHCSSEPFPAKPLHTHEKRGLLIPASRLPGLPEHLQLQVVLDDVPLRDTVVAELTKAKSHAAASVPAYQIKPAELRSCNLMGCWLMRLDRQTAEAPQHVAASAGRDVVTLYMSSKEQHSASSAPAEGAGQAARRAAATQSAASGGEARAGARALDPSEEHTAQGPLVPARDPAAAPPEVQAPTQQLQQTQQGPTTAAGVQGAAGHVALASDEAAASAAPVPDLAEAAAEAGTGLAARSATDAEVAGPAGACGPRTRSGSHAAAQLSGGAVALGGRAAGGSVGSGGHQSGVEAESPAQARVSASISPGPSARIVSGSPGAAATADGREATPGAAAKIGDLKFLDVEVQGFEPKKGSNSCEIQVYKNGVEIKHLKNIPTVDKAKSTTVRRVSCRHLEDFSDMWVQRWEASGLPRKKHVLKLFLSTSAPQQPQQPPHTEDAGADAGADAARDAAAPAEVPAAVPPEAMAAQPMATPAASCAGHEPAQRHTVAAEPPAQAMPAPQEELTAAPAPVKASGALASAAPVHPAGPSAAASLAAPAGSAAVAAAWGSAGPDGQAAVQSRDVPVDASSAAATQTVGATTEGASRAPVPDQGPQPAALAQLEAEGYAEAQPPQLLRPEPEAEAHLPPQPQPQVVPVATQEPPGPVAHDGGNVEREAAAPGHRVVAAEALEHVEPAVGPTMPADAAAKADAHCAHAGVNMPRSVPGVLEAAVHIKHNRKYLLLPANITEALPQSVSVTAVVDGTDVLDLPWRTLEVRPHDGAMHLYCGPEGPGPLNRMQLLAVVRTAHDRLELRLARPLVPIEARQEGPEEAGVPADAHGAAQLLETAAPEEDMAVSAEEQGSLRATARRRPTGEGANASASLSKQGVRTPAGAPATGAAALPSAAEAAAATQAATGAADDELLPRVPPSLRTTVSAAASGTGDDGYAPTHALASVAATPAPHVAVPGGAEAAEVTAVAAVPEAEAQAEAEVATANAGEGGAGAAAAAIPQQRSPASAAESNDSTPADGLPALRQRSVASRAVAVLGAERAAGLGSAGAGGHEATADALVAAGQWAAAGAAGQGGLDAAQPQAAGGARGACVAAAAPEDAVDDAAARDRAGNELVGILSNLARRQQWSNSRASGSGGCGDTELLVPVQRASPEQIQQMSQALSPARRSAAPPAAGWMELAPYVPPVPAPDVNAGAAVAAAGRQLASDDPGAGPPAKRPRMEAAAHAGGTRIFQLPEALFDESLMGPLHSMGLSLLMMTAFSAGPGTGAEDADSDAAAQDPESAATAAELRRLINEVMSQSRAGVAPYVAKLEFMQRLSTSLLPAAAAPGAGAGGAGPSGANPRGGGRGAGNTGVPRAGAQAQDARSQVLSPGVQTRRAMARDGGVLAAGAASSALPGSASASPGVLVPLPAVACPAAAPFVGAAAAVAAAALLGPAGAGPSGPPFADAGGPAALHPTRTDASGIMAPVSAPAQAVTAVAFAAPAPTTTAAASVAEAAPSTSARSAEAVAAGPATAAAAGAGPLGKPPPHPGSLPPLSHGARNGAGTLRRKQLAGTPSQSAACSDNSRGSSQGSPPEESPSTDALRQPLPPPPPQLHLPHPQLQQTQPHARVQPPSQPAAQLEPAPEGQSQPQPQQRQQRHEALHSGSPATGSRRVSPHVADQNAAAAEPSGPRTEVAGPRTRSAAAHEASRAADTNSSGRIGERTAEGGVSQRPRREHKPTKRYIQDDESDGEGEGWRRRPNRRVLLSDSDNQDGAQGPPQDGRVAVEGGAVYPAFPAQELFYGNGQRWKAGGKLQIHHGMRVGHTDGKRPRLLCETDLALAKEPGQLDKLSVSKSCHACDATFIAAPCEWCGIVGFCSSCYETKLGVSGQMAYTEVMAKCLKCRRLCACKRCVDLPGFGRHKLPRLRTTLDMRQDMARHALRYLFGRGGSGAPGAAGPLLPQGGALGAYLHRERAALAQAGKALEDVKEVDMRKNRTVCDLCCTSIPAMYWCCTSAGCKKEFCLQCCAEGPAEAATTAGGEPAQPRCPWEGCRGHVQLHTFMRKPFHAVVLRAEQEFGPPAAATCAAGQRVAAAAAAPSVSQSFWSPHLVILSETVLRPELFGSAKQRETAQQQALAALRRLQAWKQRQSLQQQRQQAQQPQARDGAEHSIVIQACGSEVAAAELGIGLYRPGQAVPPGKVVAWGRYVLPEQDVRLAKPWWLPGMVNPQGHAPHIFSPLAADLQPSSPRFVPYCLIFQERWALRESVLVRECPMRGDLWCPEGIFRGVEEGIRRCKEQAVRQAMKQTEKKGPAVQAAAVAEAKRKWEGAEALKIINCADGFRQVNDMSGADFAKAFRKGFEPKRTEPAVKPAAEPAAKEFMGKLKDFPPSSDYFEVLPEQWEDFVVRGLPLQWMTRPDEAPLNLATQLPSNANPTDLGPKSYIAFGTPEARGAEFDDGKGTERDSVTKLHQDMSDAVNILNFVQVNAEERDLYGLPKQSPEEVAMAAVDARRAQAGAGGTSRAGTTGAGGGDGRSKAAESQAAVFAAAYNEVEAAWREKMPPVRCGNQLPAADDPGYKLAGAEWVIWAPGEDTEALRRYLTAHVGEFQHQGEPIRPEQVDDPVFQQWFFLTRRHLQGLAREQEGRFWVFEQNEGEAVFIPGGCPHQVRNLRSCIKTAVDFVSPEAVDESLAMAAAFRKIPTRDPYAPNFQPYNDVYSDKLQGLLIAMSGAVEQFRTLYPGAYKAQASPVGSIANYNEDHYDEELERTVSAPSPKAATGRQGGRAARAEGAEGTARHAAANGQARDDDMDDEHVVDDDGDVDE
eukprot:XP_001698473.1 predicted protein [Chlamydomonas reinhardtii]